MRRPTAFGILLPLSIFISLLFALPHQAIAHWNDLSTADFFISENSVSLDLSVPQPFIQDLTTEFPGQPPITLIPQQVQLSDQGITPETQAALTGETSTHQTYRVTYTWQSELRSLNINYQLFPKTAKDAQAIATITRQDESEATPVENYRFTPQQSTWQEGNTPNQNALIEYFRLGFTHMLTGYDHLVFVILLSLATQSRQTKLSHLVMFSLACLLGLGLSNLTANFIPIPWIETAIAASIVLVAIAHLHQQTYCHHLLFSLSCGILHGLGFGVLLQELSPASELIGGSFALGILSGLWLIAILSLTLQKQWPLLQKFKLLHRLNYVFLGIGIIWVIERSFGL